MRNLIKIIYKKRLIAFIVRSGFKAKGLSFFTPDRFCLQLAYMNRLKGHSIRPHTHSSIAKKNKIYPGGVVYKKRQGEGRFL